MSRHAGSMLMPPFPPNSWAKAKFEFFNSTPIEPQTLALPAHKGVGKDQSHASHSPKRFTYSHWSNNATDKTHR
jgi:hypothetical protein